MANPFEVRVPSVFEALLAGDKGYDSGKQWQQDRAMRAAGPDIASGNYQGALAKLLGSGNLQGGLAVAGLNNNQRDYQFRKDEADRSQRNADTGFDLQRRRIDKDDLPTGFRKTATGGLEPIPGGPADPTYKRAVGDRQNAPSGYLYNDPANPSAGVKPIPGGPAEKVDAEVAARIGLGRSFLGQLPEILKSVDSGEATGPVDFATGKLGWGRSGEVHRQIASGAEALLRNLTGAGMSQSEANDYVNRYRPSLKDDAATLKSKLTQLERELNHVMETVGRGRGGGLQPTATAAAPPAAAPAVQPVKISTPQEHAALPKGASYIAPDGSLRTKQ
jgi:hypothetical protein